jgi:hypothetical protein
VNHLASHSSFQLPNDVVFVSREEPSASVNVPGLYRFTNWYDKNGKQREYACRVIRASSSEMKMYAPVNAVVGVRVLLICKAFGNVEGSVGKVAEHGFAMRVAETEAQRTNLAAKISWHLRAKKEGLAEQRNSERLVPKNPIANLILPDGRCQKCFVIDISVSGAAVSAEVVPEIGTPVAIGAIVGRVVRHFTGGFAIHFLERQDLSQIRSRFIDPAQPRSF